MSAGLIALDLATITGFACSRPEGPPHYGTKRIGSPGCSDGVFFAAYDEWLSDMITVENPEAIVFEAALFMVARDKDGKQKSNIQTARRLMGLACVTDLVAYKRGIPIVREVHMQSVRKFFVGKGNAKKHEIIAACVARGWAPQDDNAADALAVLVFAQHCLKNGPSYSGPLFQEIPE